MTEATVEVRCVACNKDFAGMNLYDVHMSQVHGITQSSSNSMNHDIVNVKEEPIDNDYYSEVLPSSMDTSTKVIGQLIQSDFNTEAVTLNSDSDPIPVSLLRTDAGQYNCQSVQDTGYLSAPEEQENIDATNSNLIEVYCPKCNKGFKYVDKLNKHKHTCKGLLPKKTGKFKGKKTPSKKSKGATKVGGNKEGTPVSTGKTRKKGVNYEVNTELQHCDQCDKSYRSASGLRRHQMLHAEEEMKLKEDERKHATPKPRKTLNSMKAYPELLTVDEIKVEVTDEEQEVKKIRKRHKTRRKRPPPLRLNQKKRKSHRKGLPFKLEKTRGNRCRICGMVCDSYHLVLKHENEHHGRGGHKCRYCTKIFNYPGVLRTHERIHTGEKPYQCVDCPRAFADCSAFRRHKKIHEKDKIKQAYDYYKEESEKGIDFKTDKDALKAADEKSSELGRMVRLIASGTKLEELKYCCKVCNEGLSNKYDFVKHMEKHTGERPYKCVVCNKGFLTKSHLRGHEFIHTGETPYACSFCGKKFNARNSMRRHEALHSGAKICKCKSCDDSFNTTYQLRKHIDLIHNGVRPYQCPHCPKGFLVRSHLTEHERTHTKERPYPCSFCGKMFGASNSLKRHEKIHTNDRPHKCDQCDKAFIVAGDLRKHMRTHSDERPFVCDIPGCSKTYKFISDLRVHKERHKNPNFEQDGSFPCSKCDLVFQEVAERQSHVRVCNEGLTSECDFDKHMEKYTRETLYVCSFCGKNFNTLNSMRRHEALHSGAKIYKCKRCDESFNTTYQLCKHMDLIHNEVRPYQCPYCPKRFLVRGHLTEHERTHTKERNYPCSFCGKRFAASNSLNRHEKIHTNYRPHKCDQCDKAFIGAGDLKKHMRTHSDERPFVCDLPGCSKTYKFISDLRVHKERHKNPNFEQDGSFPCSKCDLVFQEVAERQSHVRIAHPKRRNKPVCCQFCGKEFMSGSYLKIHERTHTGESFQCEYCGKEYIDQRLLKFHIRTHTGEKPYSCEYCSKQTTTLEEMKKHTRKHTGETPYKCKYCDKSFRDCSTRKVHEKKHSGDKQHTCTICEMVFVTALDLKRHIKTHLSKAAQENRNDRASVHSTKPKKKKKKLEDKSDTESDISDIEVYADDEVVASPKQNSNLEPSDLEDIYDSDLDHLQSEDDDTEVTPEKSNALLKMTSPDSNEEQEHKSTTHDHTPSNRDKDKKQQEANYGGKKDNYDGSKNNKNTNTAMQTCVENIKLLSHKPELNKLEHGEACSIAKGDSAVATGYNDGGNDLFHTSVTNHQLTLDVDYNKESKLDSYLGKHNNALAATHSQLHNENSSEHQFQGKNLLSSGSGSSYRGQIVSPPVRSDDGQMGLNEGQVRSDLGHVSSGHTSPCITSRISHSVDLDKTNIGNITDDQGQIRQQEVMSPVRQMPSTKNFYNWHQKMTAPTTYQTNTSPTYPDFPLQHQAMLRALHEQENSLNNINRSQDIKPDVHMFETSPLNLTGPSGFSPRSDLIPRTYSYNADGTVKQPLYPTYSTPSMFQQRDQGRDATSPQQPQQQSQNSDFTSSIMGFSPLH